MAKTVLITVASQGLGRAVTDLCADCGWNVVATMRTPSCEAGKALSKQANVTVTRLDVTEVVSIESAVRASLETYGTIDAMVNNAGYGLGGALELCTGEQVELQYNTNVLGPIRVLPTMRAPKSGVIVNISSVGGRRVTPMGSFYSSTKFA